jgi:hypothetical protein
VRDLFVHWASNRQPWRNNPNYIAVHEDPPSHIYFTYSGGVGAYAHDYRLRGVLAGTHGPILQIEYKSSNRLRLNALLFFDEQGQLLHQVDGQYYYTLPDGNLLVSAGMANDGVDSGPWYHVPEDVMAVTPGGDVVWRRFIDGRPPGRIVTTVAGNLIMSWWRSDERGRAAGIHEFDPRTGATVDDTFVDRGALCTEASTDAACLADKDRRVAQFDAWWAAKWRAYMSTGSLVSPRKACNSNGCLEATFGGWLTLGSGATAEDVMEVSTYYTSFNGSERTNSLIFTDASGSRTVAGKLVRRLGEDRLLVSTALGASGFVRGLLWYYRDEELAAVGARGAILWKTRVIGGAPALAFPPGTSTTHAGDGYLLPGNQLYYTGFAMRDGDLVGVQAWLDLATGALLPTPPKRILEGVCVP